MKTVISALVMFAIAGTPNALAQADGFAGYNYNVTGGTGGTTSIVTTAAAFITAIGASTPQYIMFSNTLNLGASNVDLKNNNKTIIGLGTNATLIGDIRIIRCTNVVIRNVFLTNPTAGVGNEDAITCQFSTRVWVDHCTFYDCGDGSMDITHAADFITCSWNKFYYTTNTGHNFVNLIGHTDSNCAEDCGRLQVTFHHNWWSTLCVERMPRVRYGKIHSYNNYFNAPGNNYCIRAAISSEVFAVKNVFENIDTPYEYFLQGGGQGLIKAVSNATINCTGVSAFNDTVFTPPYTWTPDETNAVSGPVTNYAGAGRMPLAVFTGTPTNAAAPLSVTFTDTSYGVITNRFWDFGDGGTTNTTTNVVTRTFSSAGTYTVTLTVRGPVGTNTLSRSGYIVATGGTPPPVANFIASPTNGTAPLLVSFTDTSTGSITNRFWNFGDGNTTNFASATNPTHTYASGVYDVALTVSGDGGSSNLTRNALITTLEAFQAWQLQYFACTNCSEAQGDADSDGDGLSNTNEFLAGTSPTNSASALQITSTLQQSTNMVITWTTAGGFTNVVQATAGNGSGGYTNNFTDLSGLVIITGSGDQTTNYTDSGGATNVPARYYRVRLVP